MTEPTMEQESMFPERTDLEKPRPLSPIYPIIDRATIKVKILHPDAKVPKVANVGDAGADLYALESGSIWPKSRKTIRTGIAIEIPPGYRVKFHPRSGLSSKMGIEVGAGLIDNGYRGELLVVLHNHGDDSYQFKKGDRIAQMCLERYTHPDFEIVQTLSDSWRGESGFGDSGTS